MKQPTKCLSQACVKLYKHFGIDCSDGFVRQKVFQKVMLCQDWKTCFVQMDDVYKISAENCRSYPSLCMPYACLFINAFKETDCEDLNVRYKLTKALKECKTGNVNRCLKPILVAHIYKDMFKMTK
uniref:Uncharacterized protein n=1 Tax=Romanomermis culicivorax TaxID=13658 RepID=A0A915KHH1_ROMCU